MHQKTPAIEMSDFEVLIPTMDGLEVADRITIQVPITRDPETNEEILTPEALELIEETQARYMGLLLPGEIRALRNRYGLSQRELGDLLQVGEKSYCRWETGKSRPSRSINVLLSALRDGKVSIPYLTKLQKPAVDWSALSVEQPIIVSFNQDMETAGFLKVA